MIRFQKGITLIFLILALFIGESSVIFGQSARIKDLVSIKGYRSNQLIGIGLVVGLAATGDSSNFLMTNKAVVRLMNKLGLDVDSEMVQTRSIAAVIVTAELPPFSKNGDNIDIRASVVGDAESLAGGTLLLTPLKAGDGKVYVVAQGSVAVGQANGANAKVLTVALIPSGGTVEREFVPTLVDNGKIHLSLKTPDFTTNTRISEEINRYFKGFYSTSLDPSHIAVKVPLVYKTRVVEFIAEMERLKVLADNIAIVVLNERTGTIVMGADVVISEVVVSHGDLSIQVGASNKDDVEESVVSVGGNTVGNLTKSLNALGIKPPDMVGILQAIHAAGALKAKLKFL